MTMDSQGIRSLIPHRPPLLLVEGVDAHSVDPARLRAHFTVPPDHPVLAGHFPGRPVWPGVYTIEGLAQSCALLGAILGAGAKGDVALARADVKLLRRIQPGETITYSVELTHNLGDMFRFDVEAIVGGQVAAKGTLTTARLAT